MCVYMVYVLCMFAYKHVYMVYGYIHIWLYICACEYVCECVYDCV